MIEVLIPAFNADKTIRTSVDSILRQSEREIRVLVIDDGSTDRTGEILADMEKLDGRLEIITTENRGIVDALNTGLSHCRADIVARHDADDIAFPERFAQQLSYLNDNPDCVAVGCNVWHIDGAGRRTGRTYFSGDAPYFPRLIPAVEPYLMHPFLMTRRKAVELVGGYRYVFHAEDSDLYWRLHGLGRLHSIDDILGEYRIHSGGVTSRSVVNARVSALASQLAAISAQRLDAGRTDIVFERGMLEAFQTAVTLPAMIALVAPQLDIDELRYLEIASAVKMMELRGFRKFRYERSDYLYMAHIFRTHRDMLNREQRLDLLNRIIFFFRPKFGLRGLILRTFGARRTNVA